MNGKPTTPGGVAGGAAKDALIPKILSLGPWHMNIQLTADVSTGQAYSSSGVQDRKTTNEVALQDFRSGFLSQLDEIYPQGLAGKRFLDCACNAGGYSFWARERNIEHAFGFDVREHWIRQAEFVQQHRVVAPTDRIEFRVCNLMGLQELRLAPFDLTMFKGIFYHLPDPVAGLKIAADMTREVLWLNTAYASGFPDGMLKVTMESRELVMSGVDGLAWFPTGPRVLIQILEWLGFVECKQIFDIPGTAKDPFGRLEIVAARKVGMLSKLRSFMPKVAPVAQKN